MGAALHFANKRAPPALRRNCGRSVLATTSTLRSCATHDGRLHAAHVQQLGRPVHTASDLERFLDPVLGAARLRQVAKPKRRSAPIELQTKAKSCLAQRPWSNFRCQGHKNPRPLLRYSAASRGLETLGNARRNAGKQGLRQRASRQRQFLAPNTKRKFVLRPSFVLRGSFENLLFSFGFFKLSNTGLLFSRFRGLPRPLRGLGFCANHTVAQHI